MPDEFPSIRLKGKLRPSQAEVITIAKKKLAEGKSRLHIVAPPGSGKTVLGLFLWAECVKRPALVLSPNSAIQAQWAAKTDLFEFGSTKEGLISTDPGSPSLLTSLTYQSVTLPKRGADDLDTQAIELWQEALIAKGQAQDPEEAEVWINDLRQKNANYYEQRLSSYRKQLRDTAAQGGEALQMLHASSLAVLERLKNRGLGLIIFDECHHLMEHWGRVLAAAHDMLDNPVIVGLTATPPDRDGKQPKDVERYDEFFGAVDYEVPVPAVVKDGFLAPYQDLAYFVRPTRDELSFVAKADDQLHMIVHDLCRDDDAANAETKKANSAQPRATSRPRANDLDRHAAVPPAATPTPTSETRERLVTDNPLVASPGEPENLVQWIYRVLTERRLPVGVQKDWATFERRDPDFAQSARLFLLRREIELPEGVPEPTLDMSPSEIPEMTILVPVLDRYVRHYLRVSQHAGDQQLAEQVIRRLRMLGVQITETGCQACASPVGRVMAYSRSKMQAIVPILKAEHAVLGDKLRAVIVADYEKTSATTAEVSHLLDDEAGGAVAAFKTLLRDETSDALNPILVTGSSVLVDDDLALQFRDAAQQWLAKASCDVELEFGEADGFHVINGKGADWCPRVYVAMITDLFQQGLTRCLVGTRGLLGEGWDANKINVLIDLTTVTTSMTVNQLRGRSIRLDTDDPNKLADNWDVVCIAPEFTKGLDDYKRFMAKHQTLYGATDDGAIEKGVGHVHPAFTELKPEGLEDSVDVLNEEMLARVAQRNAMRERWKIGQPYKGEPKRAIEARVISPRERERRGFPPFAGAKTPWSDDTLAQAIAQAIVGALHEANLISSKPDIRTAQRAGGYVRVFLEDAAPEEHALFTEALHEALAPLQRPRYVIPREIVRLEQTWLGDKLSGVTGGSLPKWLTSRLPNAVTNVFQKEHRERVMWHAVPTALAKNKETVEIYERHWNQHVSPGEAIFGHRGDGEELIEAARRKGKTPTAAVHEKEVFT